jgi:hypothetical protein
MEDDKLINELRQGELRGRGVTPHDMEDGIKMRPEEDIDGPKSLPGDYTGGYRGRGMAPYDKTEEYDMRDREVAEVVNEIPVASKKEELGEGADGGGKRMNAGKLRVDLTPSEWEYALADVTTKGSMKYEERNWELGMKWSTMVGCMKRHLLKFQAGERYDGEKFDIEAGTTGCHHLAMVAWNALALMSYDLRQIGTNDLPEAEQLELFENVNAETSDRGLKIIDEGEL